MSNEERLPNSWVTKELANLDLKLYLSYVEPNTQAAHTRYNKLSQRSERARYYRSVNNGNTNLDRCSDPVVADYFLEHYKGAFRRAYLSQTFPGVRGYSLAWYVNLVEVSP